MSDQALKDAQLEQVRAELNSLKNITRNLSGTCGAQKQCIEEYLTSNVQLRATVLLLEDDLKTSNKNNNLYIERIESLEKEKKELQNKIDNFNNIMEKVA